MARRAVLIEQVRKENPNTLLFDAGDIFQGTPYFNYYGGELEFRLMSMLKYDAATLGNHDFDNGMEGLLAKLPFAKFDFICSNYDFKNTILDRKSCSAFRRSCRALNSQIGHKKHKNVDFLASVLVNTTRKTVCNFLL